MTFFMFVLFRHVREWLGKSTSFETELIDRSEGYKEDHQPFSKINREVLSRMVKEMNCDSLCQAGGVEGVASALESDLRQGIPGDSEDLCIRCKVFGPNKYLETPGPTKAFIQFGFEASKDLSITILLCSAILSLVSGIKKEGWKDGWYDGVFILLSMIAIITVTAVCNFRQTKLSSKQSNEREEIQVDVLRSGKRETVSLCDIAVGDVVLLRAGGQIPADGLLVPADANFASNHDTTSIMVSDGEKMYIVDQLNPFLSFGIKVIEVEGRSYHPQPCMLVTAVGVNTAWGIAYRSNKQRKTFFQAQFTKISSCKEFIAMVIALLLSVVSVVDCFTRNTKDNQNPTETNGKMSKINEVITAALQFIHGHKVGLRTLATTATTFLLAIPEGFSLVITLLVVYSRKRLARIVPARIQKLLPCVTAGYVTTIVTDKTSFLMMNQMEVTEFRLGAEIIDASTLPPKILEIMYQGIGLNASSILLFSPDEKAIISWAEKDLGMNMEEVKHTSTILYVDACKVRKKGVGVWIRKNGEDGKAIDVHWRGSAKIILARCTHYYGSSGIREFASKDKRIELKKTILDMEANGLQCVAFAHKQVIQEKEGAHITFPLKKESRITYESGLTLLGLVGLEYQCDPKARRAAEECENAGVNVIIVSCDNILAAKSLASRCGILGSRYINRMVTEGEKFQSSSAEERMEMADKICVMARSSPSDKLLLVQCLRQKGEVVAVTGVGTSDTKVLEEADLSLSMGIHSVQILNGISDIVIMDNKLSSITTILAWGRFTYDNIQKFIQLNLTLNVAGLATNFIATVALKEEGPFTTLQMLLVNLVANFVAASALSYGLPMKEQVIRPPVVHSEPLITNVMWRNILVQALFQIVIVLTLQFKGQSLFIVHENISETLAFNTFVLCQAFNVFNARNMKEKGIFSGFHRNMLFYGVAGMALALQVVVTELLGKLFNLERLNWSQWGLCIAMAVVSWPVGLITKSIPVPDLHLHLIFLGCLTKLRKMQNVFSRWSDLKPRFESLPVVDTKKA